MQYDKRINELLEDFNVFPKDGRRLYATGKSIGQGMTTGDIDAVTFNTPEEIDLTLPSPKELNALKKAKALLKKKTKLKKTIYLPGKGKPSL